MSENESAVAVIGRLLARDLLPGREGICGHEAPSFRVGCTSLPVVCELRYGHESEWHQGDDGSRWRALPGIEAKRGAVVEAARAWRAMRADTPTTPKPESAALIAAVDALDGAKPCICNPRHRPDDPVCQYRPPTSRTLTIMETGTAAEIADEIAYERSLRDGAP